MPGTRDGPNSTRASGRFIVLEGIEGSGKSTQARLLAAWLEAEGIPNILAREPGGTTVGEAARELVLHGDAIDPRTELLLYLTARSALVADVVRPALADGMVVVADRFELSTFAYQGAGRGLPLDEVRRINHFATGGLRPDVTFFFDVPLKQAAARMANRGGADRIERAGPEFHARVADAYGALVKTETAVEAIDGTLEAAEVHARVVRVLRDRFPETFGGRPG